MALDHDQKRDSFISIEGKKSRDMSISRPTLASIESLAIPLVQEVVFLADFRCAKCQRRVAEVMSKMNGETDSVVVSVLEKKVCCMVMKINLDCNSCCRKMRRIILRMKEIETHAIEKQYLRVIVCGRFVPADVAIKIRKKMKRRVEILEIQEMSEANDGHIEQGPAPDVPDNSMPVLQFQVPEHHAIAQHA